MKRLNILILIVLFLLCGACDEAGILIENAPAVSTTPSPHLVTPAPTTYVKLTTPTPSITPTQSPVPTPFSIVWLADTQAMSYHNNTKALGSMGSWIVQQKNTSNVICVVQTGDMVDNGFKPRQWEAFDECYNLFKNELPYFSIAGNHDLGVKLQDYSAYLARPNIRSIPQRNSFERGRAVYATFKAGGTKFLFLGAGWGAEDVSVPWMNQVLKQHSDHVAILLFHSYIFSDGTYIDVGQRMFEQVVMKNPNVRLVLCGHLRGTGARFEEIDDTGDGAAKRNVAAMLYNYQTFGNNCGQIRLLTFDPLARSIHVTTYSPFTEKYYKDNYFHAAEFDLQNAF